MKKRLCSSSFSIMSVLLILIPLINSSTTAAGGAPIPMMNITDPLSMSWMSMSMEESAGGDEVLFMMDSEIYRMLADASKGSPGQGAVNNPNAAPCAQGQTRRYGKCTPDKNGDFKPCATYKRDCPH